MCMHAGGFFWCCCKGERPRRSVCGRGGRTFKSARSLRSFVQHSPFCYLPNCYCILRRLSSAFTLPLLSTACITPLSPLPYPPRTPCYPPLPLSSTPPTLPYPQPLTIIWTARGTTTLRAQTCLIFVLLSCCYSWRGFNKRLGRLDRLGPPQGMLIGCCFLLGFAWWLCLVLCLVSSSTGFLG